MPIIGEINSFAGVTLSSIHASLTGLAQTAESEPADIEESFLRRPGVTPLYTPGTIPPITLQAIFQYPNYAALQGLLRLLDYPYSQDALRPLIAYRGDPASPVLTTTQVSVDRVKVNAGSVEVTFSGPEAVWKAGSGTVQLGPLTVSANGNQSIGNGGDLSIRGVTKFGWTVQRATDTSVVGWKRRTLVSVTAGAEPLVRKTVFYNLGNTVGLILASGNDVRIFFQGQELPRQIMTQTGGPTNRTVVAWVVDIPAGQTAEYEIVWGNSSANNPPKLDDYQSGDLGRYSALDLGAWTAVSDNTSTTTVVSCPGENWVVNRWAGCYAYGISGTGSGQWRKILSNTANTFTVARAYITAPNNTSIIQITASGFVLDGGRASSSTSTVITDSSQSFVPNSLVGGTFTTTAGTGSGQSRTITANTATTITVSPALSPVPDATTQYTVEKNGFMRYYVERISHSENWRGLWKVNKRFKIPSVVRFGAQGVPDGWTPDLFLDNRDDKNQVRVYIDAGVSNHSFPIMRVIRRKSSDRELPEKGQADGVRISDPRGWDAIKFNYYLRNQNGVGKFVLASKESGGEDWESIFENTSTVASLTLQSTQSIDLSGNGIPTHLIMAASAADGVLIPGSAAANDSITLESGTILELYSNLSTWTPPTLTSATHDVYDMNAIMRLGGGAGSTAPFETVEVGGTGHRIFLRSTEQLWVDGERGEIAIYTAGVYTREVPWAAQIWKYELDSHGVQTKFPSRDFLRLPGGTTTIYYTEVAMGTLSLDYVGQAAYLS